MNKTLKLFSVCGTSILLAILLNFLINSKIITENLLSSTIHTAILFCFMSFLTIICWQNREYLKTGRWLAVIILLWLWFNLLSPEIAGLLEYGGIKASLLATNFMRYTNISLSGMSILTITALMIAPLIKKT